MDHISKIEEGTILQERYEVLTALGEGGFGQVYRARQRMTGQEVAIKVLKPRWAEDSTQLARFKREMELCARLCHPHIVRLLDTGRTEAGHLYIAFELVPGRLLAEVLAEEGALPPREVSHLMAQVLDALACAHQCGVLHRDLKPHNIILSTTGARRNALVLDFGLGKLTEEFRGGGEESLTLSRELMGTPAYAAPELLRGEEATARSDLYAWALIFLECFTGKRMVEGGSLQEVIARQIDPVAVPVPEPLRRQRLGRLLERVLSKAQEAREVSVAELLRVLEEWPQGHLEGHVGWGPAEAVEVGRRQVTALCLGLRLGGPGLAGLDEEDQDTLLLARREACLEVARRQGVSATSMLGSRLLLCLGYPQAQEDDARRAARLALELAAVLEQHAAELAPQGLELEYRLGLHTGLVLHPERSGPFGTTLEAAACLEALAPPRTALASEATARLLQGHFSLEPAGTHLLPGQGHPTPVLRLGAAVQSRSPLPPLLGRDQELLLLRSRWQQATLGQGQALLLVGEPGLGKSRLLQELGHHLHGATWLECRCTSESRHVPLRPAVQLLERLLGLSPERTASQGLATLRALLERLELSAAEYLPPLAALLGLPQELAEPALERTLESLLALLFSLTEREAVLLTVEDLQWADGATLELLGHIAADAPATRLCALFTARPEFTPPWPAMQVQPVQLGQLEPPHAEQLVQTLSAARPLPPEQVARIAQRADGVPLFLEELTRMALEPGVQPLGAQAEPVPPAVRQLFMARLETLGPALETVQFAAALGREFPDELLRALSPLPAEQIQRHLAALSAADLVYRRRGSRQRTWLFKHALLRDAAYESMPRATRRQVHARIASALREHFPELVERQPELLAHHTAAAQ